MRSILPLAILLSLVAPVQAADLHLVAPGLMGPRLSILIEQWNSQTGNVAVVSGGSVGKIVQQISTGGMYDVVLLPTSEFEHIADKLNPATQKSIGRVIFGLAVRSGTPRPDISTPEKFRAALSGKSVAFNDPGIGSLAGMMVDALLKEPGYSTVKAMPYKGLAGKAVANGEADVAIAAMTEEVSIQGIDIVPLPDAMRLHIDVSGAILARCTHLDEAMSLLTYLTMPEAAAVLKPTGIVDH